MQRGLQPEGRAAIRTSRSDVNLGRERGTAKRCQLNPKMVMEYVDTQLQDICNRAVVRRLRRHAVKAVVTWGCFEDYEKTKLRYECWPVFEFRRHKLIIAYCLSPYGQGQPWFLVGTEEIVAGDFTWCPRFATLEAAFRASSACPPKWLAGYHDSDR